WDGATWIGGGDDDLVLYSSYLPVFKLRYKLRLDEASLSTKAGFVFGANDPRLMDKNKNIYGIEKTKNRSYIKLELDISPLEHTANGLARLNFYRAGYNPEDQDDIPLKSFPVPAEIVNRENQYQEHTIYLESVFGSVTVYLDGPDEAHKITKIRGDDMNPFYPPSLNLNPVGRGGNFISFPMLADIGFAMDSGQTARFSHVEIRNFRSPSNVLFSEDLSDSGKYNGIFSEYSSAQRSGLKIDDRSYEISGGEQGVFLTANPSHHSMPMLRTVFEVKDSKIKKARLYVTARGIYEMYLNGCRVGQDYFNPGLTQYNKTHMYQVYDVTDRVGPGANAMGAVLGEGWWSGNITYNGNYWNFFGDRQSLLASLVITYTDGTSQTIFTTPETWSFFNDGPVIYGSFFQGEVYDATKEKAVEGWNTPTYDDSKWKQAVEVSLEGTVCTEGASDKRMGIPPVDDYSGMKLIGQIGQQAGIVDELTAIAVDEVRPGVFVYDMGQNMVGVPKITIANGMAGDKLTLRYAEVKYPDLPESGNNVGMVMLENIRAALAQDIYILKGGKETVQPRFTFHGYRYLEITGIPEALPLEAVKGQVISSVSGLASSYETSNPQVNKLWENITWSTRGNFLSIPTDCPQRNERMGWSGDISVFARTATYLANMPGFFRRHMMAMRDVQREDGRFTDVAPLGGGFGGILWGSAGITVAWESYQQYGDEAMLAEHYEAMKNYMDYLETRIDPKTGVMNEGPLGDWLSPEGNKNDNTLIWEAYYIFDLELMSKIASVLGRTADAGGFMEQYGERKVFFNKTYVNPVTKETVRSGFTAPQFGPPGAKSQEPEEFAKGHKIGTQASYAVPLA
ncbi:MAG: family 78 glycoside hydrolase catalytic domain, partial [Mangrovibacterium sp.]